MKLLYITNGINGAGGLERVLSVKASFLADHFGYDVTILVLNGHDKNCFYKFSDRIRTISIEVSGNPIQYWKSYKNGMHQAIETIDPDVISVCDDGLKGFFVPKILKSKRSIIYERHVSKLIEANENDNFVKKIINKIKWKAMGSLAQDFSKFVVLTNGNTNEWENLKNMMVIPNPLSFYPDQVSSLENKKVICVGKISYQKGQDLLVKAWGIVNKQFPDWTLELYGKENQAFLNTKVLDQINIEHFPPDPDIEKKYLDSSIYVMSSRFEGFGMVLIEAMACGVPCVSFDCNYGPSDIIADSVDGLLVQKEDVSELAVKIMDLIKDKEKRISFGKSARENVTVYQSAEIAKQWDQLFKNLV
ncbi:putative poly(glycerol-phosphate) alpha-glucosyltransferase [compost metagenome]